MTIIYPDSYALLNSSEFRGTGKITENVTTSGGGGFSRRVRVYDQQSGMLLTQAYSSAETQIVMFEGLALNRPYVLYALDETDGDLAEYQAVAISHRFASVDGSQL